MNKFNDTFGGVLASNELSSTLRVVVTTVNTNCVTQILVVIEFITSWCRFDGYSYRYYFLSWL
jgi:hypothetical protein